MALAAGTLTPGTGIAITNAGGSITIATTGTTTLNYTNVTHAMSPYTVLSTDYYISVDCSAGGVTLNFPNAPTYKQTWIVKDRTGNAANAIAFRNAIYKIIPMAITKSIAVDQVTVTEYGVILFREATRILEDGVELSKTYHRSSIQPGQDISAVPSNVQAICNVAWTPEVVAAFQASQNNG